MQSPNKKDLESLYQTKTLTEIAVIYNTTRTTVSRWFDSFEIEKRPRGGGNNRKVVDSVDRKTLLKMSKTMTNDEIAQKIGCSNSNVGRLLTFYVIKRDYHKSELAGK